MLGLESYTNHKDFIMGRDLLTGDVLGLSTQLNLTEWTISTQD